MHPPICKSTSERKPPEIDPFPAVFPISACRFQGNILWGFGTLSLSFCMPALFYQLYGHFFIDGFQSILFYTFGCDLGGMNCDVL